MTDVRRGVVAVSLMLLWWVVTYGFGSIPFPELQPGWFPNLGTVITNLLSLGAVWAAAALFSRAGWLGDTGLQVLAGWRGGEARMLWAGAPVLLIALGYLWLGREGVPGVQGDGGVMISLAIGMLALGVSEETGSRGLPLGAVASTGAIWRAVLVTSVLFGLWHLGNGVFFGSSPDETWWQVLSATTFGVCFARLRLFVGSIWPGVVLHALGNWTQLITPGAAPLWYQIAVMAFEMGWGVLLVALWVRRRASARPVSPGA
ncbi:CPBP family intramembrane glutamic endopeptidase [Microbacterium sp. NPDC057944]|uniref:CPBP family intramembrane glutamic endopeptidase n=1 Tax=Microbacterium sp. NPDC057944 TaxID=3346286 RepID=UPI0036D8763D